MNKLNFLVPGLLAVMSSGAFAQDPGYAAFVEQTNSAVPIPPVESLAPAVLNTLQEVARAESACVPSGVDLEAPQTATAVAVVSAGVQSSQIKNGWTVYGRAAGCPDSALTRFMVLRFPDDSLRAFVVNQGETLANPSLMRDTSAAAAIAALQRVQAADPACTGEGMRMGPTRIAERGADLGPVYHGAYYAGSWSEVWTFIVCGRSTEVPVQLTADGQGGANYNVRSTEVRLLDE